MNETFNVTQINEIINKINNSPIPNNLKNPVTKTLSYKIQIFTIYFGLFLILIIIGYWLYYKHKNKIEIKEY